MQMTRAQVVGLYGLTMSLPMETKFAIDETPSVFEHLNITTTCLADDPERWSIAPNGSWQRLGPPPASPPTEPVEDESVS